MAQKVKLSLFFISDHYSSSISDNQSPTVVSADFSTHTHTHIHCPQPYDFLPSSHAHHTLTHSPASHNRTTHTIATEISSLGKFCIACTGGKKDCPPTRSKLTKYIALTPRPNLVSPSCVQFASFVSSSPSKRRVQVQQLYVSVCARASGRSAKRQ